MGDSPNRKDGYRRAVVLSRFPLSRRCACCVFRMPTSDLRACSPRDIPPSDGQRTHQAAGRFAVESVTAHTLTLSRRIVPLYRGMSLFHVLLEIHAHEILFKHMPRWDRMTPRRYCRFLVAHPSLAGVGQGPPPAPGSEGAANVKES